MFSQYDSTLKHSQNGAAFNSLFMIYEYVCLEEAMLRSSLQVVQNKLSLALACQRAAMYP